MMFLNMYENTDNGEDEEYVESLPESYSEEDLKAMEEAKKQKEEQLKVWKEKMQQNAMMFLSDTGVIVRHRKRREVVDNFWRKHHKLMNSRIGLIINDIIMILVTLISSDEAVYRPILYMPYTNSLKNKDKTHRVSVRSNCIYDMSHIIWLIFLKNSS